MHVLAVKAAKDATKLVAKLQVYHHIAQTKADKQNLSMYYSTLQPTSNFAACLYVLNTMHEILYLPSNLFAILQHGARFFQGICQE